MLRQSRRPVVDHRRKAGQRADHIRLSENQRSIQEHSQLLASQQQTIENLNSMLQVIIWPLKRGPTIHLVCRHLYYHCIANGPSRWILLMFPHGLGI